MIQAKLSEIRYKVLRVWWGISGKLEYGVLWRIGTCRSFLQLAWLGLRGRIVVVNTHKSQARGGYKYISIVVSKRPLSKDHTLSEFLGDEPTDTHGEGR